MILSIESFAGINDKIRKDDINRYLKKLFLTDIFTKEEIPPELFFMGMAKVLDYVFH